MADTAALVLNIQHMDAYDIFVCADVLDCCLSEVAKDLRPCDNTQRATEI